MLNTLENVLLRYFLEHGDELHEECSSLSGIVHQKMCQRLSEDKALNLIWLKRLRKCKRLDLSTHGRVEECSYIKEVRYCNLEHLNLSHCTITDNLFSSLRKREKGQKKKQKKGKGRRNVERKRYPISSSLRSLNISFTQTRGWSVDSLIHLTGTLPLIQYLSLENCRINNTGMRIVFTRLKHLKALNVRMNPNLTSFSDFPTCESPLEVFNASATHLKNGGLDPFWLQFHQTLKKLDLSECYKLHEFSTGFASLSNLESLNLARTTIQGINFRNFRNLIHLNLESTTLSQFHQLPSGLRILNLSRSKYLHSINQLSHLKELKTLNISWTNILINATHLGSFEFLSELISLDFSSCKLCTDLSPLYCLSQLREVCHSGVTQVVDSNQWKDFYANLPHLERVDARNTYGSVCPFQANQKLTFVCMEGSTNVSDDWIRELPPTCAYLNVSDTSVSSEGIKKLRCIYRRNSSRVGHLQVLLCRNVFKGNLHHSISAIAQCVYLRSLDLTGSDICDENFSSLRTLSNLHSLSIQNCLHLTGKAISIISTYFLKLICLDTTGCFHIPSESYLELITLKNLTTFKFHQQNQPVFDQLILQLENLVLIRQTVHPLAKWCSNR